MRDMLVILGLSLTFAGALTRCVQACLCNRAARRSQLEPPESTVVGP